MAGFFSTAIAKRTKLPTSLIPKCDACQLYKGCKSPKMPIAGKGRKGILVIGEAPGETEDEKNKPFVGPAGKQLQSGLAKVGIELFKDCWITNALICRPPHNETPDKKQIGYCRPNVIKAIKELKPERILLAGAVATKSVLAWLWKDEPKDFARWVGWVIPSQEINAYVCPTYHPSALLRQKGPTGPVMEKHWLRHLQALADATGRPWTRLPAYADRVQVVHDTDNASRLVYTLTQKCRKSKRPIAFDYETTTLKPDSEHSHIWCCSLSDGETTFAFPWQGKVKRAMREFLLSDVPKVGSNNKFEERWTIREFGFGVNNWHWDTMLAAHWLDNRKAEITSVKFQSFVLLGFPPYLYNAYIEEFLKGKGGNGINRIKEANLSELLRYNGLDSLVEWEVAKKQMEVANVKW